MNKEGFTDVFKSVFIILQNLFALILINVHYFKLNNKQENFIIILTLLICLYKN